MDDGKKIVCMFSAAFALVALLFGHLIFLPVIVLSFWCLLKIDHKQQEAFRAEYQQFLKTHEGQTFFCYTSRKNSKAWVEQEVIPNLSEHIEIVFLEGRKVKCRFPIEFISHALEQNKNAGFPTVMKIVGMEMLDAPLHNELYEAINQNVDPKDFIEKVHLQLSSFGS